MPHFGLMDEYSMEPHDAALVRARLHVRSGMRRLRQGKLREGVLTLYDALYYGMRHYVLSPKNKAAFEDAGKVEMYEESALYNTLRRMGALGGQFDFGSMFLLVERILDGEKVEIDAGKLLVGFEETMTRLGVMPFDEAALPPEDPKTF